MALVSTATIISVAEGQTLTQAQAGFPSITGAGEVRKAGGGTLVLNAVNPYTGPTVIEAGGLVIANAAAVAGSSSIDIAAAATLDVRPLVGGLTVRPGQSLGGAGTVVGAVTFGQGATLAPGPSATATTAGLAATLGGAGTPITVAVPEPTALGLVGVALACLAVVTLPQMRAWP